MATTTTSVAEICARAERASRALATLSSDVKNAALEAIAAALIERTEEILEANARDMPAAREAGLSPALIDRLALSRRRVAEMAAGVRMIAALPDPVGEVVDGHRLAERSRRAQGEGAAWRGRRGLRGATERDHRCGGAVPEVGQRDRAAGLELRGALQRRAGEHRRAGCRGRRPARRRDLADRRRRARGAGRAGHPDRRRRPDHPARRRGAQGRAEGRGHGAGDLRRLGQLPCLRRRQRRSRGGRGDRAQRQAPAPVGVQRGRDAARARRRGGALHPRRWRRRSARPA